MSSKNQIGNRDLGCLIYFTFNNNIFDTILKNNLLLFQFIFKLIVSHFQKILKESRIGFMCLKDYWLNKLIQQDSQTVLTDGFK